MAFQDPAISLFGFCFPPSVCFRIDPVANWNHFAPVNETDPEVCADIFTLDNTHLSLLFFILE
jgi:hypothetical protein